MSAHAANDAHGHVAAEAAAEAESAVHAAGRGDLLALEEFIKAGLRRGYPAHVTLQTRDALLGTMPLHAAAEFGQLAIVKARRGRRCLPPARRLNLPCAAGAP